MEINNAELKRMIDAGETDEDMVFTHRYIGGQIDYGITDGYGNYWAWFGGDLPEEVVPDELNIVTLSKHEKREADRKRINKQMQFGSID